MATIFCWVQLFLLPHPAVWSDLITPLNLWSLWVPIGLLGFIILAAVYFVRVTLR